MLADIKQAFKALIRAQGGPEEPQARSPGLKDPWTSSKPKGDKITSHFICMHLWNFFW